MITLTTQLDRLEETLPAIPARIVRLQRTVAGAAYDQCNDAVQTIVGATRTFVGVARISGRTVTGQTRAASSKVLATARRNANLVVGQTKAQTRRVTETAQREVTGVVDAAIDAVDPADALDTVDATPGSGKPYEQWTKAELVERAKELDIEGRSGLDKKQLIAALRKA